LKGKFKLLLSQGEHFDHLLVFIKLDRVRDLGHGFRVLVREEDLGKMGVESIGDSSEFFNALVFFTELKDFFGCLVIELEKLAV